MWQMTDAFMETYSVVDMEFNIAKTKLLILVIRYDALHDQKTLISTSLTSLYWKFTAGAAI